MAELYPFSEFTADCRSDDHIVCYDGKWTDGKYKTWLDFLRDTARMRRYIKTKRAKDWLLHCDDSWYFLIAYSALMQCEKDTYLVANTTPGFLSEIRNDTNEFLTDNGVPGSVDIAAVLSEYADVSEDEVRTCPKIDAEKTVFYIFTSGSTGKPKPIYSRLKEYEENNAFNLNQWADIYGSYKLIDTVSQCHSYGVAYTVQIPFTAGIPFRRKRVMTPSEFEAFTDTTYMIVTVPAFLKRTIDSGIHPKMKVGWIYTSGGVLTPDVARGTDELFGFWPVEMYGSTETCGVGWRQSKNGLAWTPFTGAHIWKTEDGCLGVKSPCVREPDGFVIKDLVELLPDGRFLMNGRADSIVKIEEKRISLVEVENRLLQSGMVNDVSVVALASERRQYLAAAIVFTKAGREAFAGKQKFEINRWFQRYLQQFFENVVVPKKWRYLDEIPMDMQGKKKKLEIQALFTTAD
ncbi:MAG: AMP-binding protein [Treponema sp.]|nr:AMP-binding protein [Treponema sp.]